ncbi:MAG: DUF2007 domain-containing protein [Firmicutes bacterium]|nr:DUF2007 domain-containing protein [Bacillota bacterium]
MSRSDEKYEEFLVNVKDINEAEIIMGLLKSEGIPAVRKHIFTGDYLEVLGNSTPFGVNIFVPPSEVMKAKEILDAKAEIIGDEFYSEMDFTQDEDDDIDVYSENKGFKMFIKIFMAAAAVFVIGALLFL